MLLWAVISAGLAQDKGRTGHSMAKESRAAPRHTSLWAASQENQLQRLSPQTKERIGQSFGLSY